MMHVAGIPSMVHVAGSRGVFDIEFEWYCTAFLGAMYVGISMFLKCRPNLLLRGIAKYVPVFGLFWSWVYGYFPGL